MHVATEDDPRFEFGYVDPGEMRMTVNEARRTVADGALHRQGRRPARAMTIVGTTGISLILYEITGSWHWTSALDSAPDGRPITEVQLGGDASAWGASVIVVLGVLAWVLLNRHRPLPHEGHRAMLADHRYPERLLTWMSVYVIAVGAFTVAQAVLAILLVDHHVVPPFLLNGTVHVQRS
jgi:hypothetical protein